uniref:Uncharacterized protein n=1 Tax=Arundo donax TaxID=35708 RepID=A0A0A9FIW1_ARUDO
MQLMRRLRPWLPSLLLAGCCTKT